jgi:hypothetical protein
VQEFVNMRTSLSTTFVAAIDVSLTLDPSHARRGRISQQFATDPPQRAHPD